MQGRTTLAEASWFFCISLSEFEAWVNNAKKEMENVLRIKPLEVNEQYVPQIKDLQEA